MATAYGSYDTSAGYNAYRAVMDYSTSQTETQWTVSITGKVQSGQGSDSLDNFALSLTIGDSTESKSSASYMSAGSTVTFGSKSRTYQRGHSAVNCLIRAYAKNDGTYTGWTGSSTAEATVTIPAKPSYTVSYNANGGSGAPSSQTKWHGETLTLSSTKPTRTGYTFQGWGLTASTSTASYSAGGSYTSNASDTLYAVWKANTYTVSYAANGGSSTPSSQTKTHGVALTLRAAISRTNATATYTVSYSANYTGGTNPSSATATKTTKYSFSSWKATNGTLYSAGGSYTANAATTMTAQWTSSASTTSVTLPTPTRTGYTFGGWYKESSCTNKVGNGGASYTPTASVTLYAKWTVITYTVSYAANGGSSTPASQTKTYDVALTLRSAISHANGTATAYTVSYNINYTGGTNPSSATAARTVKYAFAGWKATSGTTYSAGGSYTANASTTMTAQWTSSTTTASVTLPTPTRSGYTFGGWYKESSCTNKAGNAGASYTPDSSRTLYARWTQNVWTVTYAANGGSSTPSNQTKYAGTALTLRDAISHASSTTTITVTLDANGGSSTGDADDKLTSKKTVSYAFSKWKATNGTLYAAKGSYTTDAATTMTAQWTSSTSYTSVTLPTPTRTGYTFNGWYTAKTGGSKVGNAGATYKPTASLTLYAQWTVKTYTVTFNANGGSGAPASQTKTHGDELTLSSTKPTRSGYTFLRWNTSKSGTGTAYPSGGKVPEDVNSNLTLYAEWIAVSLSSFSAYRSNSAGTKSSTGTYGHLSAGWKATGPADGTVTVTAKAGVSTLSTVSGVTNSSVSKTSAADLSKTSVATFTQSGGYSESDAVKVTVTVKYSVTYSGKTYTASAAKTATIPKEFRLLDALHGGTGLAIGTIATLANTFEVALSTILNNVSATIKTSNIDRDGTAPSEAQFSNGRFRVTDVDNETIAYYDGYQLATGETGARLVGFAEDADGASISNSLRVGKMPDGTNVYYVTDAAAFRKAINAAGASDQSAQNVLLSPMTGTAQLGAWYWNVTNENSSLKQKRVAAIFNNTYLSMYNSTDATTLWRAYTTANPQPADAWDVYKSTTVANVISAESGVTVSSVTYAEWGKVAQLSVVFTGMSASTGSQTVGTVVDGKRPVYAVYATDITSDNARYAAISTAGVLNVYWTSAPSATGSYTARFIYILA